MNKRGSTELVILGLIAVIALIGLVMMFKGGTGKAGQPLTRQVLPTEEDWRVERPGNYQCECWGNCVYDGRAEGATTSWTKNQADALSNCKKTLENRCSPQALVNFRHVCTQN